MKIDKNIKSAQSSLLAEDYVGFNSLNDSIKTRNLPKVTQDRMIDISYWLWENYPLSKWIIEIIVSFVLADGLPWRTDSKIINQILKDFWTDPVNKLDSTLIEHVREFLISGELLLPFKVSPNTGRVRMGFVDPKLIDTVFTDPDNAKLKIGVVLKKQSDEQEARSYKIRISKEEEDFLSQRAKSMRLSYKDGDCFFFTLNSLTNSTRGRSELFAVADWIDLYENFLYDYAEKWSFYNNFVWDLTVEDGDESAVKTHTENFRKIASKPGSTYGHNQKIKLQAMNPDLKAVEVDQGARLLRNHILGCIGLPSHWYGGAEDVNKASSQEMGIPTFKILSAKQNVIVSILKILFDCQIEYALVYNSVSYGRVTKEEINYEIIKPEINVKDLSKFGAVIKNVADGVEIAEINQWIDKRTAREIFTIASSFLGKEFNIEQIETRLKGDNHGKNIGKVPKGNSNTKQQANRR